MVLSRRGEATSLEQGTKGTWEEPHGNERVHTTSCVLETGGARKRKNGVRTAQRVKERGRPGFMDYKREKQATKVGGGKMEGNRGKNTKKNGQGASYSPDFFQSSQSSNRGRHWKNRKMGSSGGVWIEFLKGGG